MSDFFGCFIFIENNTTLMESVLEDKKLSETYPCLHHRKLSQALSVMKTRKDIRAVVLSSTTSESRGEEEVKKIRELYPEMPIVFLNHNPTGFPQPDFSAQTTSHILIKPASFADLIAKFKEIFKKDDRFDNIQPSPEAKDVELTLKDKDYVPMRLEDFLLTDKSFFNVFIKLGQDRFVKILNVGDAIETEFISKYNR